MADGELSPLLRHNDYKAFIEEPKMQYTANISGLDITIPRSFDHLARPLNKGQWKLVSAPPVYEAYQPVTFAAAAPVEPLGKVLAPARMLDRSFKRIQQMHDYNHARGASFLGAMHEHLFNPAPTYLVHQPSTIPTYIPGYSGTAPIAPAYPAQPNPSSPLYWSHQYQSQYVYNWATGRFEWVNSWVYTFDQTLFNNAMIQWNAQVSVINQHHQFALDQHNRLVAEEAARQAEWQRQYEEQLAAEEAERQRIEEENRRREEEWQAQQDNYNQLVIDVKLKQSSFEFVADQRPPDTATNLRRYDRQKRDRKNLRTNGYSQSLSLINQTAGRETWDTLTAFMDNLHLNDKYTNADPTRRKYFEDFTSHWDARNNRWEYRPKNAMAAMRAYNNGILEFDVKGFAIDLAFERIMDRLYGTLARGADPINELTGRPIGISSGPAL